MVLWKSSFLIYVRLTRVLLYLKPSSLNIEQKTRLNSRSCQLNYNSWGLGKRSKVTQINVNIIFICTATSSPRNIKSTYQFPFKNLIFNAIRVLLSWNSLKFSIVPVLKSALFLFDSYTKTTSPLLHVSEPFSILNLVFSQL